MKDTDPKVTRYAVNPYAARALILNLEMKYDLTIRVCETNGYCAIHIDKEVKRDDNSSAISQGPEASRH